MDKLNKVRKQLGNRSRHMYQVGIRLGLTYGVEVYGIGWGDMLAYRRPLVLQPGHRRHQQAQGSSLA